MREIIIRPFQDLADYRACEELQQAVWKFPDREIVPVNELIGVKRSQGLLLGAFLGRRMVGFVFGMHGVHDPGTPQPHGRVFHVSRMLAVLSELQGQEIGYHLKAAQRTWCLQRGVEHACWTFDPLQAGNAHFNVSKLGATSSTYLVNVYGTSRSVLNAGMETDRLQVDWVLASAGVRARMDGGSVRPQAWRQYDDIAWANRCRGGAGGRLVPSGAAKPARRPRVAVEIPPNINEIMRGDLALAHRWRRHVRALLQNYFRLGFRITDFVCTPRDGREAMAYVLERIR